MNKRYLLFIIFLSNWNSAFSQVGENVRVLLKADIRTFVLQPKLSAELFLIKRRMSLEAGGCAYIGGADIHHEDFTINRAFLQLLGFGPAKGHYLFSDLKYITAHGVYIGIGYLYRYSHFHNAHYAIYIGDVSGQPYNQSENAYSNYVRTTLGAYFKFKDKNIYANPYGAIMVGEANLHLKIDTTGLPNQAAPVQPVDERRYVTTRMIVIGCNFCFGFPLKKHRRRPEE